MIINQLKVNLESRFAGFLNDPIYHAAAIVLDAKNYKFKSCEEVYSSVSVIEQHFSSLLKVNDCDVMKLRQQFSCLFSHVTTFLSKSTNEQIWQQLFVLGRELAITDILHIMEICIVLPVSSADIERVFSSFAKTVSKERQSLKTATLENILVVRHNDFDGFNPSRYEKIVKEFLENNPDGTVRKGAPRVCGYKKHNRKPKNKPKNKKNCLFLPESLTGEGKSSMTQESESTTDSSDTDSDFLDTDSDTEEDTSEYSSDESSDKEQVIGLRKQKLQDEDLELTPCKKIKTEDDVNKDESPGSANLISEAVFETPSTSLIEHVKSNNDSSISVIPQIDPVVADMHKIGDWVIVLYDEFHYPGTIVNIAQNEYEVSVMQRSGNYWKWPVREDKVWYQKEQIFKHVDPPTPAPVGTATRVSLWEFEDI